MVDIPVPGQTDGWTLLTIVGLAGLTVLTRCFFLLSAKPWTLPQGVQRGLQYAPIAALGAVVLPEVMMSQGSWVATWQDARVIAALVGGAWFFLNRGVLGTILVGMAVYLPLRLLSGW